MAAGETTTRAFRGQLVTSLDHDLGLGKLAGRTGDVWHVEYFDSPASQGTYRVDVAWNSLRPAQLAPQTRVHAELEGEWRHGRVIQHDQPTRQVFARLEKREERVLPEAAVLVRWNRRLHDATDLLSAVSVESRRFFDGRSSFVRSYIARQAAYERITALASASIELHPHQIEAVRRVLSDPTQRYLLADEVGLGKTIEAAIVIRQHLLDRCPGRILVVVPDALVTQWAGELNGKFRIDEQHPHDVDIVSFSEFAGRDTSADQIGMVVVDEAHRVAGQVDVDDVCRERYRRLQLLAAQVDKLILLSATPLTQEPASLHRLLHLLSPTSYPLDELAMFERALASRDEVATFYASLHPESQPVFLRAAVDGIRSSFGDDAYLATLLDSVESSIDTGDQTQMARCVRRARAYVAEAYRLYDRMIRTRRGVGLADDFPVLGRREPDEERFESDELVSHTIDAWREHVAELLGAEDEGQPSLVHAARAILEAAGSAADALGDAARARLGDRTLPPDADEQALLTEMVAGSKQRATACPRIAVSLRIVLEELNQGKKVAVAVGTEKGADAFVAAIARMAQSRMLFRVSAADPGAAERFTASDGPGVVVIGPEGEEGQNLQAAELLVHVDLPWDPNRLEQRLGRFDRFGAGMPARQVVIVDGRLGSLDLAWLDCLRSGFGIFTESVASVQLVIDSLIPDVVRAAVGNGAQGLADASTTVREHLSEELQRIELAELLDETTADDRGYQLQESTAVAESARSTEEWAQSVVRWAAGDETDAASLRFHHTTKLNEHAFSMTPYDRPSVDRIDVRDLPLIPLDTLARRFSGSLDSDGSGRGAFRRLTAARRAIRLLAPGDPFVDALWGFTDEDDRGRSFATWRPRTRMRGRPEELAFRFDVRMSPDVTLGLRALGGAMNEGSEAALRRRAESYLSPLIESVWLRPDGTEIQDEFILDLLDEPHSELQGDVTLRPWLWTYVDEHVPRTQWEDTCTRLRDQATELILDRNDVAARCGLAAAQLIQDGEDESARIRARREPAAGPRADTAVELARGLGDGVLSPLIEIDAAGIVVLSSNPLPADETR